MRQLRFTPLAKKNNSFAETEKHVGALLILLTQLSMEVRPVLHQKKEQNSCKLGGAAGCSASTKLRKVRVTCFRRLEPRVASRYNAGERNTNNVLQPSAKRDLVSKFLSKIKCHIIYL